MDEAAGWTDSVLTDEGKAALLKPQYTTKATRLRFATNAIDKDYTEREYMACTFSIPVQVEVDGKIKVEFVVATVEEDFKEFCEDLQRILKLPKTPNSVKVKCDKDSPFGDQALGAENLSATLRFLKTRAPKVDKLVIESCEVVGHSYGELQRDQGSDGMRD